MDIDFEYLAGRRENLSFPDEPSWSGCSVVVTGAGGSIGSALSFALAKRRPRSLVLIDWCEGRLKDCAARVRRHFPAQPIRAALMDVGVPHLVGPLLQDEAPDVVIHTAAYKHVSVLEDNLEAAVQNNVLAMKTLFAAARDADVKRFIYLSTDKAADPIGVLGATKRVGELFLLDPQTAPGVHVSVLRLANVLGSSGSVLGIFQSQLDTSDPITITDPRSTRYFVSFEEAVRLATWSCTSAARGSIFTLHPGAPVLIYGLAERMAARHNLALHRDKPVVFIGMQGGERLIEPLHGAQEHFETTPVPFILRIVPAPAPVDFAGKLACLEAATARSNPAAIRQALTALVPTYATAQAHPHPIT